MLIAKGAGFVTFVMVSYTCNDKSEGFGKTEPSPLFELNYNRIEDASSLVGLPFILYGNLLKKKEETGFLQNFLIVIVN
jgi:hypothetical protein